MSIIHAPEETALDLRQLLIPGVILLFLTVYVSRLWFLQVVISDDLKEEASRTQEITTRVLAPRGEIIDRSGHILATVRPRWVVTAIPSEIRKNPKTIQYVADLLRIDVEDIERKLADAASVPDLPTVIYIGATIQQATRISESNQLTGIGVETRALRTVSNSTDLSHLLGYVGRPNDTEEARLKGQGIVPAEYVGRDGIERVYEAQLCGTEGIERMVVDARRRPLQRMPGEEPIPGQNLELSLDIEVQKLAEKLLSSAGTTGRGAVVAIDPRNGEIIALASAPSFNLMDFEGGISKAKYDAYVADEGKPFLKRPIAGTYSPGSTFKIVNALSAAVNGDLDLNRYVTCNGGTYVGKKFIKCQNHAHGSMNFYSAMAKSCNTYFIDLARRQGAGPLGDMSHMMGLGQKTGIDVPGELQAFCPTTPWVEKQESEGNWYPGHTANMGIGQGELRVTPLQMAQIAAIVGTEGVAYQPHVVRAFIAPGEKGKRTPVEPKETVHLTNVPDGFWKTIRQALTNVIETGTAKGARIQGVQWAGKTGSTENSRGPKTHAWFVGFAPAENPTIAIAVLVENAGHGGDVSAPIARQVVNLWLERQGQKPASASRNADPAEEADSAPAASPEN